MAVSTQYDMPAVSFKPKRVPVTLQVQAFASLAMVAVLFIFVAATFRAPLPKPLTSDLSGLNFYGYSSIADMPISLFSATVFSEAMWQRCWATVDKRCAPLAVRWLPGLSRHTDAGCLQSFVQWNLCSALSSFDLRHGSFSGESMPVIPEHCTWRMAPTSKSCEFEHALAVNAAPEVPSFV